MNRGNGIVARPALPMLLMAGVLLLTTMAGARVSAATLDIPVSGSRDDAEETVSTGAMTLTSADLEMPWDGSKRQQLGMRFLNVTLPVGATITQAYIQFAVDRADTGGVVNLTVKGQKLTAPATFASTAFNISSRTRTMASVNWLPPRWTTAGASSTDQRTPDLSAILQELIGQSGWASGNPVVLIIEDNGSGNRTFRAARTFDSALGAPVLHVEYSTGGGNAFQQDGTGLVSMEAEHATTSVMSTDGHQWLPAGSGFPGYSGLDALQSLPEDTVTHVSGYAATGARLDYQVNFVQTGTHYLWVRARGPLSSSNSLHVGLDGQEVASGTNIIIPVGGYVWVGTVSGGSRATLNITAAGQHTVNVWMRESGTVIDKIVLTKDSAFNPATLNGGLGPIESPQGGTVNNPPIAMGDTLATSAGSPAVVNVLANDTDGGDGGTLSVISYDTLSGQGGTLSCTSAGACTFTPAAGYSGADTFTYTVSDGFGTAVGLVDVTITAATGGGGFQQEGGGLLVIEAEHSQTNAVSSDGHQWLPAGTGYPGYSGSDVLRALPEDSITHASGYASTGARLGYQANFVRTGTHYLWVRALGPSSSSNSLHVGLDGQEVASGTNIIIPVGGYVWVGTVSGGSRASLNIATAGLHTINVWMRESGTVIDKIVLTKDSAFNPATLNGGLGPIESPQGGTDSPTGLIHYWKFDETSGTTFQDQTGAASASCTQCPTQTAGRVSNARSFDGSLNAVDVSAASALNWANNARFSIEFWMNSSFCNGSQAVLGRHDLTSQLHWWAGCQNGNAAFTLLDKTGGGSPQTLVGSSNVADGGWHHIVAIRDAISGQNRLYVDGMQQASVSVSYAAGFDSAAALNIGWLNDSSLDYHFAGKIDEVAIHGRVLPDSEIRRHYTDGAVGLRRGYQACGAPPVRIMPLGDSNTAHWNPGFRPGLYFNLLGAGMDLDLVGGQNDSCAPNCGHDSNHEGHSGFTPTNIANNVNTWLNQNPPDVVMLHIGTNVNASFPYPNVTEVARILDSIKAFDPNITVVLARIINKARTSYDPQLTVFNQNLASLAQSRIDAGDKLLVVDQEPVLDYSSTSTDFAVGDDLHPTAGGYAKMVPVWFNGLNRFLPGCVNALPQVISQPPIAAARNTAYVYVAEATGVPAPVYSLTSAPGGMTIHPDTGRIEWTPTATGSYGVTLQVANLLGSSTQSFTIVVN